MPSTRIIKRVDYKEFKELIDRFSNKIIVNSHAYFRLNEMQRKVYKDEQLINILIEEKPVLIGIQGNNNYTAFFNRKEGYLRIIFEVKKDNIEIITFYITETLPKI